MSKTIAQTDDGKYVDESDLGWRVYQDPAHSISITSVYWLRWGAAQFGSTGILGRATTTAVAIRLNVIEG